MNNVSKHITTKLNNYKTLYVACLLVAILAGGVVAAKSDLIWFKAKQEQPFMKVESVDSDAIEDLESPERQKFVDVIDPQKTNNNRIVRRLNALL